LLGTPEVRHAREVLAFPTRKTLALLIYLTVERGVHSREKLTAFFWPESDAARGRGSLRNTLGYLRTALHEVCNEHPVGGDVQGRHLITERDTLGFNFTSDCHLDLQTLEGAFTLARMFSTLRNQTSDARQHLLTQLQHAVNLYRGGFLDGFFLDDAPAFDDWVSFQRDLWHLRVSFLFDRLSQLQFGRGEPISAIETATRWMALDPLNEAAYQRVMQVYFATGNREAALRAYDTCRVTLQNEMQAQPTPATKALAERIRATVFRRSGPREGESSSPHPPLVLLESPFVGRGTEYSKLVEIYHHASRGQMEVGILEGEAGIGKTRLATEFLGWAVAQGADVLQGQAFEAGGRVAYQSLVEALRRRLEREHAPGDLLSDVWLAELSRLLPELCERYPDLPPLAIEEAVARTRLFEAIARLGQALSKQAPLVLFIDDVQWADAASLDVLQYVSRRWAESGTRMLLLVGLRSEAVMTTPLLTDWLSSLGHYLSLTRLLLAPLTLDATLLLVQSLAPETPYALLLM
jgi:DNA-binding SARP family transcriptional activator